MVWGCGKRKQWWEDISRLRRSAKDLVTDHNTLCIRAQEVYRNGEVIPRRTSLRLMADVASLR